MVNPNYSFTLDLNDLQPQIVLPIRTNGSKKLQISITNDGEPYKISKKCVALFCATKSDGTTIVNNCTLEMVSSDTKICYETTPQTTASVGLLTCDIRLYEGEELVLTTPRFYILVDSRAVADENLVSKDEFGFLDSIILEEAERVSNEAERQLNEEARQNALVTGIKSTSTYDEYASAKAVYNYGQKITEFVEREYSNVDTDVVMDILDMNKVAIKDDTRVNTANGEEETCDGCSATPHILYSSGDRIFVSNKKAAELSYPSIVFFDAERKYISGYQPVLSTSSEKVVCDAEQYPSYNGDGYSRYSGVFYTVPEGTKYYRISYQPTEVNVLLLIRNVPWSQLSKVTIPLLDLPIDKELDENSENPVQNKVIVEIISAFATKDELENLKAEIQGDLDEIGDLVGGKDGKSAYQIALDNGFEGTEEEWLESLNGPDGFSPIANVEQTDNGANITITDKNGTTNATVLNGKDGKSAYQIALDNGFEGTEEEWLESLKGPDGFSPTAKVEQTDNGANITITDKNGTTNTTVLNGNDGKDGTSVTVKSVSESTADGGSNVVTFSDGKTLTVKNGSKGSTGATGPRGADGYTPVKGTDYFTEADKTEMVNDVKNVCVAKNQGSANVGKILAVGTDGNLVLVNMPEGGVSGDVIGTLDESNNILLSGNLADGTYTLKYENADGTYAEVGSLVVGAIEEPTNFADTTSEDWKTDSRLSGGNINTTSDLAGGAVTNYILVQPGDTVEIEGINFADSNSRAGLGTGDKTSLMLCPVSSLSGYSDYVSNVTYDNNSLQFTITETYADIAFTRVSGILTGTAQDVVITITRNGTVL